jgi:hypothetical protein
MIYHNIYENNFWNSMMVLLYCNKCYYYWYFSYYSYFMMIEIKKNMMEIKCNNIK